MQKTVRRLAKDESGWAIVSTLISIVIGLLMIGGIFVFVKQSMDNAKVTDATQQLQTIKMHVKQIFSNEPSYAALGTSGTVNSNMLLQHAGAFPDNMVRDTNGNIRNSWDGQVFVYADASPTRFIIEFRSVPQSACMKLATGRDWRQTRVNGGVVWDESVAATNDTAITTASSRCNSSSSNTLLLTTN